MKQNHVLVVHLKFGQIQTERETGKNERKLHRKNAYFLHFRAKEFSESSLKSNNSDIVFSRALVVRKRSGMGECNEIYLNRA